MTDATAKFPGTTGTSQLAQSDVGGEIVGIGEAEWTLATQILSGTAAPLSIVVNETVSARVPTTGWLILDSEIFHFNALNTGTKTFTADARSQQDTAAGQHDVGTWVGFTVTKRWYNQIVADIISMQTQMLSGIHNPNLVLNSDFSRRTVFGLAMPEVFADLSGTTKIDGGAAGAVASNIFTQGAANNEYAWCAGSFVWMDGRASATFKATAIAGIYELKWRITSNAWIAAKQNNGNFTAVYATAGADGVDQTVANVLTINRWYWLEVERQGSKAIVKIYDTGGTVPGVTKASSTLLQTLVFTAAFTGAPWTGGAHVSITSDQAAAQWGGIATGNGGVYVETWLPESWSVNFDGTLGGQAFGFDEAADSGPQSKQWTPRAHVPAAANARRLYLQHDGPDGGLVQSVTYAESIYVKTSGITGGNATFTARFSDMSSALVAQANHDVSDLQEATFTRKPLTWQAASTSRRIRVQLFCNFASANAGGTYWFSLPQLEQGSAVTAWRGAPADDAPIVWEIGDGMAASATSTSGTEAEIDSRNLAGNFFFPWDCNVLVEVNGVWTNSGLNNNLILVTGGSYEGVDAIAIAAAYQMFFYSFRKGYSAGKQRLAVNVARSAGTLTLEGVNYKPRFRITAYRGK